MPATVALNNGDGLTFEGPTDRWTPLEHHDTQQAIWSCDARFIGVLAGRRSGKSEVLAKRRTVVKALECPLADGWFWLFAPTNKMARDIFWEDLKALIPPDLMWGPPKETEMTVRLVHGPRITCSGLQEASRRRGVYIDGCVLDEFDYMKKGVWEGPLRPTLSTKGRPPGWALFLGTPDGRGPLYRMYRDKGLSPDFPDWAGFKYTSHGIVDGEEIAAARREMDARLFAQEYEAEAMLMQGRVYYGFDPEKHAVTHLQHRPNDNLHVCFDFNVEPGVAVYAQETRLPNGDSVTDIIGEVWIPRNSNTPAVCKRIIADWKGKHHGKVVLHGDATGGRRHTSQTQGSDWDLIREYLKPGGQPAFGSKLVVAVGRKNPGIKDRIHAMNSRLESADGKIHMRVDPRCTHVIEDFEGVQVLEGGTGEPDKDATPDLTHLTDALGYMIESRHPVGGRRFSRSTTT